MNVASLPIMYMSSNTMKKGVPHLHMKTVFDLDSLVSAFVFFLVLFCSVNFLAFDFSMLSRFLIFFSFFVKLGLLVTILQLDLRLLIQNGGDE